VIRARCVWWPALVCCAKLLGVTGTPALAHAEIATFRNLVPHVAARVTRGPGKPASASTRRGNTPTPSPKPG
jgi:hypothetical protein